MPRIRSRLLPALTAIVSIAVAAAGPAPSAQTTRFARPAVSAGGLIFASAVDAVDEYGEPIGEDVATQTRVVLDRLAGVLSGAGSSLARAAALQVYLADPADFVAMNDVYAGYFPVDPPTRTTVVGQMPAGVRVVMSAVAVHDGGLREVLHPEGWAQVPRPYSYIVRTEHLVFLSGLVSRRGTDDAFVGGSLRTQMRTILGNARVLLQTAGREMSDLVSARVFLADGSLFDDMSAEYRRHFVDAPPARATVVAPLMSERAQIEMTFIAARGERQLFGPTLTPSLPLSTAVGAGPFVFLSGIVGNSGTVLEGMAAQARKGLLNVDRALLAAGLSLNDVVDMTTFVRDRRQQDSLDRVYGEFYPSNPPARTVMGASLSAPPTLVEFIAVAVR